VGITISWARLRRLTPAGVVLAMLAALLSLGAQAPASAADLNTVTAQLRLSTGATTEGYYEVYQKDPDPATTYSPFADGYAPGGSVDVDLPPGQYKLGFFSFDSGDEVWYHTGSDTGADIDSGTPVVLSANKDLGIITFQVRTIVAVVKDQGGHPVPNVDVHLAYDPDDLENNWWDGRSTDSQGRAVFRNQSTSQAAFFQAYDDFNDDQAFDPSDVKQAAAGTANATVNLTMQKLATVSGHVVKSIAAGEQVGEPIGMITVRVLDAAGEQVGSTATTLSDGSYTVTGVPAGSYTVEFSDQLGDYATQYWNGQDTFESANYGNVAAHEQKVNVNGFLDPIDKPAPTDVDLKGVVSGRGQPLENVLVTAYRNGVEKGSVRTGRDGTYAFSDLTSGSYKVSYDRLSGPADTLPFASQWYLGSRSSGAATPVAVTQDTAGASRNVTLDSYGVITGSVLDKAGNPISYSEVDAYDVDDLGVDYSESSDGTYRMEVPPGSYHLRFDGWDDASFVPFIAEWWDNSTTLAGAKAVNVAPGQTVTASAHLTKDLEPTVAPTISGTFRVGSPLTASTGTWNLMADNDYQYAWFRGATQVGSARTYTPTTADAGSTLTVQVSAWHGSLGGTAFSAPSATIKYGSTSTVTGKSPKAHRVRLTVAVSVPGVADPGGTVTIKRGSKTIKTGVVLADGVAVVKLRNQPSGKRKYSAVYGGTSKILSSTSSKVTITVKG
jgi:hypothetical protein